MLFPFSLVLKSTLDPLLESSNNLVEGLTSRSTRRLDSMAQESFLRFGLWDFRSPPDTFVIKMNHNLWLKLQLDRSRSCKRKERRT